MKEVRMLGYDFVDKFELEGKDEVLGIICNSFIDSMIASNPLRRDMGRADWLCVMMNNYYVVINDGGIFFEPK
jgi:hypothetical protein